MSRPNELNQKIAELNGWTNIHSVRDFEERPDIWVYKLVGIAPKTGEREFDVPDCENDLNAAIELFDIVPDEFTPRLRRYLAPVGNHMERWYKAHIMSNDLKDHWQEEDREPSIAICKAWLAWKEQQS